MRKRNRHLRKLYAEHFGPIPPGRVIHHWVPVFAGGTDDMLNLAALTPSEHMQAHWTRWKELGDFRDLCSYYIIGYNFTEAARIWASVGGTKGGSTVKSRVIGICTNDLSLRSKWASLGGKAGAKSQMETKIGIHGATPEQNKQWASMGGKKGAFTQSKWQKEFGRRGGPKNKGFIWVCDGSVQVKYTKKMQDEKPVEVFLAENPTFRRGRPCQKSSA